MQLPQFFPLSPLPDPVAFCQIQWLTCFSSPCRALTYEMLQSSNPFPQPVPLAVSPAKGARACLSLPHAASLVSKLNNSSPDFTSLRHAQEVVDCLVEVWENEEDY